MKKVAVLLGSTSDEEVMKGCTDYLTKFGIPWHLKNLTAHPHPDATPAQLKDAVVGIAKKVWNQFYAPVLGGKDTPLLGIYSHMISYPLYLFNYPLGHLIAFQIEEQVHKAGSVGPEIERMTQYGMVTPFENGMAAVLRDSPALRAMERTHEFVIEE